MAYLALTARFPIDPAGAEDAYFQRLTQQQPAPIKSSRADLDDGFAAIIDRCLNRQPARRYLDADELLDAVNGVGGTP